MENHAVFQAYSVLAVVSVCCPHPEGRLFTCYSPVCHSISKEASFSCPLVRLACVKHAASVHPEPGSNSPSKINGLRARPVLTTVTLIGSVRFIWFCLIGKGISRGRLSAALRKTNPSQTISNGSMSARMRHIWCVHPRSIRFSRCTPARSIRSDRAARQGDILPDRRGPGGGNLGVHISYTYKDSRLAG